MPRRLPILPLLFAATLGLFSITSVLTAQQPKPAQPEIKPSDVDRVQRENAKTYQRFADELLRLAQRWEKSDNPDEKERAKSLRAALKIADEKGVKNLFDDIVKALANPTGTDLGTALNKDIKLVAALEEILKQLETEDDVDRIKREIAELKKLKEEIERIKRDQENVRARTENPRGDRENIANAQNDLAKRTDAAAQKFPGDKNNPNANANGGGQKEDPKAEQKPEQKPGDANPEAKPDTSENKSNDKAGMGSPMPGMGEPKGGEQKPSPAGGMPPGDNKPNPKDGMGAGEPKPGEAKPMGGTPEPKNPMDPKAGQQEPKPGDSKSQGEGKGEQKPQAGQPGGEGKPMSGQQSPMGGQPSQPKPSQGGGQPPMGGGQPPMGGQQQPPQDDAQENVKRAVPDQQDAEQNIRKNENKQASKKQDDAIEKLEKAIKELEKRLKQLREKELEKLLANLEERVGRMLRMQVEVYEATKAIHETVQKHADKKPTTAEVQKSQSEADREAAIIAEAEKCLKLMESEGSAVVFAGVLSEVKIDMNNVQKRLNEGRVEGRDKNVAKGTQLIEEQIIKRLTLMKEALKKARQDLQDQQNSPPPPDGNSKPPNQKLIDLINQLKLLKLEQELVNERTVSHSKEDPGEQAKDPQVQLELKQLSERQAKLKEMLHKLATEANQ